MSKTKEQPKTSCGTWQLPKGVELASTMKESKRDLAIRLAVSIEYSGKMRKLLAATLFNGATIAGTVRDECNEVTWVYRIGANAWIVADSLHPTGDGDMSIWDSASEAISFYREVLRSSKYGRIADLIEAQVLADNPGARNMGEATHHL